MNKTQYTYTGWTPLKDGTFAVYEIDWEYIHRFLVPKAKASKRQQTKTGPLRVRIVKNAEPAKRGSLHRVNPCK